MSEAAIIDGKAPAALAPRAELRARRQRKARQKQVRLLVLLLAILLPTVAAQGQFGGVVLNFGLLSGEDGEPALEPFEIPGESFPGSAFYWLEDAPRMVNDVSVLGTSEGAYDTGQFAQSHGEAGAAAEAFRAGGTGLDKARALQCLSMAVYYEAASESYAGQEAVAQVVLNRVAHPAYPNSVCGVVFQGSERKTGCQFTFTCDGSLARHPSRMGWARAQGVALAALAGHVYAPVGLATHYHTNYVNPYWASSLDFITTIGAHRFYRWKGNAGRPGAFNSRYSGVEGIAAPAPGSVPAAAPTLPTPPPNSALGIGNMPDAPVGAPVKAAAPKPADSLPQGGEVKAEYRNSGRWIAQPGAPKKD